MFDSTSAEETGQRSGWDELRLAVGCQDLYQSAVHRRSLHTSRPHVQTPENDDDAI